VDVLGLVGTDKRREWLVAAGDKRIGPKARIKHIYALTDKMQLPVRLYYEDKPLATILE
jgi:hypothetical protein